MKFVGSYLLCVTLISFSAVWGLSEYCREKQIAFKAAGLLSRREICPQILRQESNHGNPVKKLKLEQDSVSTFSSNFLLCTHTSILK